MRGATVWGAGVLVILLGSQAALGQAPETDGPDPGRDAEARALFTAGKVAYEEGRYDDALDHFERAYALSGRPELLYNMGQTLDRLRRDAEAVKALRRFLDEVPDTPHRKQVAARIRALEQALEERERAGAQEVPTPEQTARAAQGPGAAAPSEPRADRDPDRGGVHTKWWLWTGVGALVVTGVVVAVLVAGGGGATPYEGPDGVHAVLGRSP